MHNSGKRLGIAMATVVVVLGLNAFAVLSGVADSTYASLFGYRPADYLVASRVDTAAAGPVPSAKECAQSGPRQLYPRSLAAGIGSHSETVPITRIC
jgi:hypothetical protein